MRFEEYMVDILHRFENEIKNLEDLVKIKSFSTQIYPLIKESLLHGKRLRAILGILSYQAAGGEIEKAIPLAVAIELAHNASLIHDDIVDNDEMRRGRQTVHVKWDLGTAILAGDGLLGLAYKKLLATPNIDIGEMAKLFTNTLIDICEGQALDKTFETMDTVSESDYLEMIEKKTAALFDVSCSMGAICANAKQNDISKLSSFGKNLGIAFQITDDLIGVMGDSKKTKKPVGNDLREGKKSLPIVLAITKSKGNDKKIILKSFGNPNASKKDIEKAVKVIRALGIEKIVRKQALQYSEKAKKSLNKI